MKTTDCSIRRVDIYHLKKHLKQSFSWATGTLNHREAYVFRLILNCGVTGWGEVLDEIPAIVLRNTVTPALIGMNGLGKEHILNNIGALLAALKTPDEILCSVLGGLEIALLDIEGRYRGLPFYRVFQKKHVNSVMVYASGFYYESEGENEMHRAIVNMGRNAGCRRYKIKVGRNRISEDVIRICKIKELLGEEEEIMVDANQVYTYKEALKAAKNFSKLNVMWFEEPLRASDTAGYRLLKSASPIPIAAGESWAGEKQCHDFISKKSISVFQPNVNRAGGPTVVFKLGCLALSYGITVALHGWGSPILRAASIHVAGALGYCATSTVQRESVIYEWDCTPNPLNDIISEGSLPIMNGEISVPNGVGLGIEINAQAIHRYAL